MSLVPELGRVYPRLGGVEDELPPQAEVGLDDTFQLRRRVLWRRDEGGNERQSPQRCVHVTRRHMLDSWRERDRNIYRAQTHSFMQVLTICCTSLSPTCKRSIIAYRMVPSVMSLLYSRLWRLLSSTFCRKASNPGSLKKGSGTRISDWMERRTCP